MTHDCGRYLRRNLLKQDGIDAEVSDTILPIVENPYGCWIVCPHGTAFYVEPTGEQIMQWNRAAM